MSAIAAVRSEDSLSSGPNGTGDDLKRPVLGCVNWAAILVLVMVGKVTEWVPGLSAIPLAKIAFLIAAISAFRNRASLPPVRLRSLKIARPAIAFMILAILSIGFSIFKSNSLATSQLVLVLMLSMILLIKILHDHRDVERILLGFAAAAGSLSIGLLINFHGGRADINENFDPNDIAYALVTTLPIALAVRKRPSRAISLLFYFLIFAIVVSILLTGSRGGAIGLGVVVAATLAFPLSYDKVGELKRFSLIRVFLRVGTLGVLFALSWGYLPSATQERMATLLDLGSDYNADPTVNGSRTKEWRRDFALAMERPIGYGLGSAEIVDGLHGGQYRTAHNSCLQAFVELGLIGLWLFLYTYFVTWRQLGRVYVGSEIAVQSEARRSGALYARALRVALIGNFAAGFFLSQAYSAPLWLLVGLSAGLVRISVPPNQTLIAESLDRSE